jgi:hypothetical protein
MIFAATNVSLPEVLAGLLVVVLVVYGLAWVAARGFRRGSGR